MTSEPVVNWQICTSLSCIPFNIVLHGTLEKLSSILLPTTSTYRWKISQIMKFKFGNQNVTCNNPMVLKYTI